MPRLILALVLLIPVPAFAGLWQPSDYQGVFNEPYRYERAEHAEQMEAFQWTALEHRQAKERQAKREEYESKVAAVKGNPTGQRVRRKTPVDDGPVAPILVPRPPGF